MIPHHTIIDLIRHGEPEGGSKFRGSLDDPLSELGREQMARAVSSDDGWHVVATSPLKRCREFAENLAIERNLPIALESEMREVSFGDWEGQTSAEITAAYGEHLEKFWINPVAHTPPGGEALESLHERVIQSWTQLIEKHEGEKILLVCHGGVIRVILADILGIPLERAFSGFSVPFACRTRIRIDRTPHGTFQALLSHTPLCD